MKTYLAAMALALSVGCSAVYVRQPIGDVPADIAAEAAAWEGTWMSSDGAVTVHVTDGSNGLVTIAWDEKSLKGLTHKTAELHLRSACGDVFVSTPSTDEGTASFYAWARIKVDDRVALVWSPDVPKFRDLVATGTLPGATNGENVVLSDLDTNHLALICAEQSRLLRWDEPLVFWKMSE